MAYNPTKPYKKQILTLIKQTWQTPYIFVRQDIYPLIKKKFPYPEVDHTDGIGTKGFYHWQQRSFKNAVLDALAMNLNDLALMRATPYKLQNHLMLPQDDPKAILTIISHLCRECRQRKIAVTGGETSIQDNLAGLDIGLTVSGFIKTIKPNQFRAGDVLIGLKSNGLHSNGFTKVREIFGQTFRPDFIKPTKIYLEIIFDLDKKFDIHGMMHITGGAFTKLKDLLSGANILIARNHQLKPQPIFQELSQRGISDKEMYQTFNCGIGFIISSRAPEARQIIDLVPWSDIIGEVVRGSNKIKIQSMFSRKEVNF